MTSDLHDWSFWLLVGIFVLLLISLVLYLMNLSRRAWLGDRWIEAAGSYEAAVHELVRFEEETDLVLRRGMVTGRKNHMLGDDE